MPKPEVFCIYAFLDRSIGEAQNLTNLLSTLLIQLLERGRGICDAIDEKFEEFRRSRLKPTTKVYLELLKSQMEFLASRTRRIFLVVDALDQCDDETLSTFLKACEEFPPNVHLLFTSAYNDNEVVDLIKPDNSMEIAAHDQDIRSYFEVAFNTNQSLQRAIKNSEPSFRDQVLRIVVQRSQRNFLLATLHMGRLLHNAKSYPSLKHCLKDLDESQDEFYEKAIGRSMQMQPLVGSIMSWLVLAKRPITVDELAHAMEIQRQIEDIKSGRCLLPKGNTLPSLEYTLKHFCAGIVEIDDEGRVGFLHPSARQYLLNSEAEMLRGAQTMITDICLVSLHHMPPEEITQSIPSAEALVDRCKQYPLLRYAADHWGHHLLFEEKGKYDINLSAWEFLTDARRLSNATQIMLDFEFRQEQAVSGMHVAAYFGLVKLIRKAKKNGRSVDTDACTTHRQESVLHWAVKYGKHDFLRFLVEDRARLTSQDSKGRTALYVAVAMEDLCSVEILLSPKGPRLEQHINIAQRMQGWAPLHCAVYEGKSQVVEKLLDAGAKVNQPDNDGCTPICSAFQQGYLRIVEQLVDKKASLEFTYPDGKQWSLLEQSSAEGRTTVIQLLIEKGVDLGTSVTDDGKTPLRLAVEYRHPMIMCLLIEARVDIDEPDSEGRTPLYWAAENGRLSAMCLLLEKNANTTASSKAERMTPLHIAALQGHEPAVLLLLTMGADPFQRDINSHTSLYWAIIEGHKEVVQLLLLKVDARRLIHDRDDEDRTALHHAASQGYLEISEILLSYGADSNAKDVYGNTALQLAENGSHRVVYEYLLRLSSEVNSEPRAAMTTPEAELQDRATPRLTDSFDTDSSFGVEELSEQESDSQWSGDMSSDTDNADMSGRFRARVEDYYEDE